MTGPQDTIVRSSAYRTLQRISLRERLIAILVALLILALGVTAFISTILLHVSLVNGLDEDVRTTANRLAANPALVLSNESTETIGSGYAIVFMPEGGIATQVLPAPGGSANEPAVPTLTLSSSAVETGEAFEVGSVSGTRHWRVVATSVTLQGKQIPVAVAAPTDGINETISQVVVLWTVLGSAAVLAAVFTGWSAIKRAFRPLSEIEDTAAAIAAGDLSRRIPVRLSGDEVASLATSLNSMLSQIERSFQRVETSEGNMRRFVADASHELRTPLAAVRGYAELYRQGAVTQPEHVATVFQRIEDEATRMGVLVEDLLSLARLDEHREMAREPVDLTVLVADAAQDARALAPDRTIGFGGLNGKIGTSLVLGDEPKLRQVITNLVANAVNHTPAGTPIELKVGTRGDTVVAQVIDHGHGIDPGEADRVFERFYRHDASRTRSEQGAGGSGLGLAIVKAITVGHGGTVRVEQTPGGGATFVLELPAQR